MNAVVRWLDEGPGTLGAPNIPENWSYVVYDQFGTVLYAEPTVQLLHAAGMDRIKQFYTKHVHMHPAGVVITVCGTYTTHYSFSATYCTQDGVNLKLGAVQFPGKPARVSRPAVPGSVVAVGPFAPPPPIFFTPGAGTFAPAQPNVFARAALAPIAILSGSGQLGVSMADAIQGKTILLSWSKLSGSTCILDYGLNPAYPNDVVVGAWSQRDGTQVAPTPTAEPTGPLPPPPPPVATPSTAPIAPAKPEEKKDRTGLYVLGAVALVAVGIFALTVASRGGAAMLAASNPRRKASQRSKFAVWSDCDDVTGKYFAGKYTTQSAAVKKARGEKRSGHRAQVVNMTTGDTVWTEVPTRELRANETPHAGLLSARSARGVRSNKRRRRSRRRRANSELDNPRGEVNVANPCDYDWTRELYYFSLGAYGDTHVYVWANGADDAMEEMVEWVDDNAPGLLTTIDESDLRESAEELGIEYDPEDVDYRIIEHAETDMYVVGHTTLTHGNAMPSWEIHFDEVTGKKKQAVKRVSQLLCEDEGPLPLPEN